MRVFLVLLLATLLCADEIYEHIAKDQVAKWGIEVAKAEVVDEVMLTSTSATIRPPARLFETILVPFASEVVSQKLDLFARVKKGEVIATLRSGEFIDMQREFLASLSTLEQAKSDHVRKERLYDDGIISLKSLEASKASLGVASSGATYARGVLEAFGLSQSRIEALATSKKLYLSVDLISPADGVLVAQNGSSFTLRRDGVSDVVLRLSRSKDLRVGEKLRVLLGGKQMLLEVANISKVLDPASQSSEVVLRGKESGFSDYEVVEAKLFVRKKALKLPSSAVGLFENEEFVFVDLGGEFMPTKVHTIARDGSYSFIEFVDFTGGVATSRLSVLLHMMGDEHD